MTQDGDLNPQEETKSTRNGKYVGNYKKVYKYSFSFLIITLRDIRSKCPLASGGVNNESEYFHYDKYPYVALS